MTGSLTLIASILGALSAAAAAASQQKPGNIAPLATATASSTRPGYPLVAVNDGRMDTQWGTDQGMVTGQWLRFDWKDEQEICGVALLGTGPWTQTIDVQVERAGSWVSVAKSGTAERRTPVDTILKFKPVRAKALRFAFEGGAAYFEVQIFSDPAAMAQETEEYAKPTIAVAGDLRGHLTGTVSRDKGAEAIRDAEVTVTGQTPNGPWTETTKTGEQGEFEVPLPFAAQGTVKLVAATSDGRAEQELDTRDISTQLTPKSEEIRKDAVSLCGTWDFAVDPPASFPADQKGIKWNPIKVPAHWEMEGFSSETGRAVYRKTFQAPAAWRGRRVKLLAEAVYSHAQVWVNGHRVGAHEGGYTPFELDVTDAVKAGKENTILVLVDARTAAADVDFGSYFAYFELAGIWQPIEVFATAPTYVSHLTTAAAFDKGYKEAKLTVEFDAVNERAQKGGLTVQWRLYDPHGREVPLADAKTQVALGPWDRKTTTFTAPVKSPQLWNAEQPRLYKLVAETTDLDGAKGEIHQALGFRKIEVDGNVLKLNGTPVKFRSVSRLDAHPLMGRALTPEIDRLDMEMIKAANFNMVRATIAPPHPASLDASDEIGLYVENEGPACWGSHAHDLRYAALYRGIMCEFIERDRNHPSVVVWSICNESDYGETFSMARKKMTELDPTRIYSATDCDHSLDIDTYHYPLPFLDKIKEFSTAAKPVFYDEVTPVLPHGVGDLGLFQDLDPGMGDYWIEGLPETQRAINEAPNQVGVVQFAWVDDKFAVPGKGLRSWRSGQGRIRFTDSVYKLPGRGILGENAWGTVDGWRRPRPVYWLSKKLYSPILIEEKPLALPDPGKPIVVQVENWNQFADLSDFVCRWEIAGEHGEARAHGAPMGKGTLELAPKHQPQKADRLTLRFFDDKGRMVDAYKLAFKPHDIPVFPNSGKPAGIGEHTGYLENAYATRLIGAGAELAYDRNNGELFRALAGGEIVMTLGPKLHVQKATAPMLEYPTGAAENFGMSYGAADVPGNSMWCFTGSETRTEGDKAVLDWKGRYGDDFAGGFQIRMDDAGDAEFHYEFTYKGPDLWVREIGLEFQLPLNFDKLSWDRNAEYSFYPDDHIGRPVGEAVAHPAVPQTVPAGNRPYGLDDHALGCNDFRSVKRHVYTAKLTDKEGQGVEVFSDGSQSVRATLGMYDVSLKVLDYYGGAGWVGRSCWHCGPGRLIKTGEVLKGTVRLKLLGKGGAKR